MERISRGDFTTAGVSDGTESDGGAEQNHFETRENPIRCRHFGERMKLEPVSMGRSINPK
jgi:hypothetical protein